MRRIRVIPVLLLHRGGLHKSRRFRQLKYVGDPVNAVRIFNEKEVDEIVVLDIDATAQKRRPDVRLIGEIAGEAFMPLAYGGGITSVDDAKRILYEGVEKVVINHSALHNLKLIEQVASQFGSSSVVVSIDYKKNWFGKKRVYTVNGKRSTGQDPRNVAIEMQNAGAGEIFLNSIERDGMYSGYDLEVIKQISQSLTVPLVVCGGASSLSDFKLAIDAGASAVAAGSMFVFQRPHQAVLITYPSQEELKQSLFKQL